MSEEVEAQPGMLAGVNARLDALERRYNAHIIGHAEEWSHIRNRLDALESAQQPTALDRIAEALDRIAAGGEEHARMWSEANARAEEADARSIATMERAVDLRAAQQQPAGDEAAERRGYMRAVREFAELAGPAYVDGQRFVDTLEAMARSVGEEL